MLLIVHNKLYILKPLDSLVLKPQTINTILALIKILPHDIKLLSYIDETIDGQVKKKMLLPVFLIVKEEVHN